MLHEPSIDPQVGISVISVLGFNWMDPIIENLPEVRLSSESKEADKVRRVAAQFWLSQDRSLYKRSFGGPYLLCLHPFKINDLLTELLKGYVATTLGAVAGSLSDDPRVLVAKYAEGCCRICEKMRAMLEACPNHTSVGREFKSNQQLVAFCTMGARYHWAISPSNRNRRFVLVVVDYFTKWVKAEALTNI